MFHYLLTIKYRGGKLVQIAFKDFSTLVNYVVSLDTKYLDSFYAEATSLRLFEEV